MSYYVRKIARAKWFLLEKGTEDIIDNYNADTIANDMRTQGNTLSLWKIEDLSDASIEPVIVINSLLGDTIAKIDLIFIPDNLIKDYPLAKTEGNTVVANFKGIHRDVTHLSVGKHILFAKNIILKIISGENQKDRQPGYQPLIRRYSEKQQIELIEKWIQNGEIDFEQLKPKQKEAVLKQRKKMSSN